jgi:hypothetical protein
MELKPGSRWRSAVCEAEIVVVRAPKAPVVLECGGHPMAPIAAPAPPRAPLDPAHAGGALLGKRYADESLGLEILCSKAGAGSFAVNGAPLSVKDAKKLPSSD